MAAEPANGATDRVEARRGALNKTMLKDESMALANAVGPSATPGRRIG
jgi:hypothetical protein